MSHLKDLKMIKTKADLKQYLEEDRKNYPALLNFADRLRSALFSTPIGIMIPQYKYLYYLRKAEFAINSKSKFKKILYLYFLRKMSYKTGFQIPPNVLGPGVTLFHFGMIVINGKVRIGRNAKFQPNVVIGKKTPNGGVPIIGDNFYVCAGARIYGDITIGNNVRIGPNCCLYKSVPDNCVVVGNPAVIVKKDGEKCRINL